MPPVPPAPPLPKWVFTVDYRDDNCKRYAIGALKAIDGVDAKNDDRSGSLLRDVTVTVPGDAYHDIPGKILAAFGSVQKKFVAFKVTFKDPPNQNKAVKMVKELKGVRKVEFEGNASNAQLIVKVFGDADRAIVMNPGTVLTIFQTYGTARFH